MQYKVKLVVSDTEEVFKITECYFTLTWLLEMTSLHKNLYTYCLSLWRNQNHKCDLFLFVPFYTECPNLFYWKGHKFYCTCGLSKKGTWLMCVIYYRYCVLPNLVPSGSSKALQSFNNFVVASWTEEPLARNEDCRTTEKRERNTQWTSYW